MVDVLQVEKRDKTGTSATRQLRRSGQVPAVLYGHGEENQHLAIPATQVKTLVRHHSKMVELAGAIKETALVSQMHWDPLGIEVLHLDLIRVSLKEKVEVSVPIQRHGDPAGLHEGGILIENIHDVEIRCSAGAIPDHVRLNVSDLHLGGYKTAADLELPEGVELVTPSDTTVAHIEEPKSELEPSEEGAAEGEPEIISKGGEKDED